MKLSEVLEESAVLLDLNGLDKWRAIDTLTDRLVSSGQVVEAHRERVHEALVARERSMSTGMENGLAIPHTSVEELEQTVVALGIATDGIDFEAIDGRPTHLVVLLVNPANRTKTHIRTLAEIARLLSSPELRSALVGASSAEAALEVIRAGEAAAA